MASSLRLDFMHDKTYNQSHYIYKSRGELFLLVQHKIFTIGPEQSCNVKKLKQDYIQKINFACFINLSKLNFTQHSYKKYKKLTNSKLPSQPKPAQLRKKLLISRLKYNALHTYNKKYESH